jgi:hypothetical protein
MGCHAPLPDFNRELLGCILRERATGLLHRDLSILPAAADRSHTFGGRYRCRSMPLVNCSKIDSTLFW